MLLLLKVYLAIGALITIFYYKEVLAELKTEFKKITSTNNKAIKVLEVFGGCLFLLFIILWPLYIEWEKEYSKVKGLVLTVQNKIKESQSTTPTASTASAVKTPTEVLTTAISVDENVEPYDPLEHEN